MLKPVIFFILVVTLSLAQDLDRFSNNPLPPLNVFSIYLSESVDAGKQVINDLFKEKMRLKINFPSYFDPTYQKLKDQNAVDISLFGESASGRKFKSNADSMLNLKANLATILVIDRQKKVRAFSQVFTIDIDNLTQLVEELLLNIDGKEIITIDSEKPDEAFGWQTDLGKETYEKANEGKTVIDFGAGKEYWYKYLGKEVPDFLIKKEDGTDYSFHKALDGKVNFVVVSAASGESDFMFSIGGIVMFLNTAEMFYNDFQLGKAEPGKKFVENAKPDVK